MISSVLFSEIGGLKVWSGPHERSQKPFLGPRGWKDQCWMPLFSSHRSTVDFWYRTKVQGLMRRLLTYYSLSQPHICVKPDIPLICPPKQHVTNRANAEADEIPAGIQLNHKNTGMGCHALLQGIFPTQGSNPCLLHWQEDAITTEPPGKPWTSFRLLQ